MLRYFLLHCSFDVALFLVLKARHVKAWDASPMLLEQ